MIDIFEKMLRPLKTRIANMVARAVLQSVNDSAKMQLVQLGVLAGETRTDVERLQNYGFTSVPIPGAEAAVLFVGGRRDHGLVLAVDDRRYRLVGLQQGEVAMYTDQGDSIKIKRGGDIEISAATKVHVTSPLVQMDSTTVDLNAPTVTAAGALDVTGSVMAAAAVLAAPLPISSGGTSAATPNAALNALLPAQSGASVLGSNGTNTSWLSYGSGALSLALVARDASANAQVNNLIESVATTATAGGTTALVVSSAPLQIFTGTSTQIVTLPDATTLPATGFSFWIINRSTGVVTVKNHGGTTVLAVPAGAVCRFICTDASTANGVWDSGGLPAPTTSSLGAVNSHASVAHQFLTQIGTDGSISAAQPAFTDISGTVGATQLPTPTASTLGGVESHASVAHQYLTQIGTDGSITAAQPVSADISDAVNSPSAHHYLTSLTASAQPVSADISDAINSATTHNFLTSLTTSAQPASADISDAASAATASVLAKRDANGNCKFNNSIDASRSTATAAGTTTLSASDAYAQIFTGTSTQTVKMPDATTLSVGWAFRVVNRSTGSVTMQDNSAGALLTLTAGTEAICTCTGTGSAAGTWDAALPASGSLPTPTAGTLGGVFSHTSTSHQFLTQINTDGSVSSAQPASADISDATSAATASVLALRDSNGNCKFNNSVEAERSTATSAGTTTLSASDAYTQIFTGTHTQTLVLPDCTTLALGWAFRIVNRSTGGDITVQKSGGTSLATVWSKTEATYVCTDISSAAGAWDQGYPTIQATQLPAFTGDVTSSAGSVNLTIGGSAVTNAKLATMSNNTVKGNVSGSATTPSDIAAYQLRGLTIGNVSDQTPTNGSTVSVNYQTAAFWFINCGTGVTGVTIGAPSNAVDGGYLEFLIYNNSGGTLTTTWTSTSGFRLVGGSWTDPANGKRRAIGFRFINTLGVWIETWRSSGDV